MFSDITKKIICKRQTEELSLFEKSKHEFEFEYTIYSHEEENMIVTIIWNYE